MTASGRAARTGAELGPLLRSAPWRLIGGVAGVTAPAVYWAAGHFGGDPDDIVWAMRGFAVLLALGAAFGLDDEALPTLAASPASYCRRRRSRVAITVALVAPPWFLLLLAMGMTWPGVPWIGVTIEAASLCLVALALAGAAQRLGVIEPGQIVAPVLVFLLLGADAISPVWPLLERPGPLWEPAHLNWGILAILSAAVLLATGRDPGHRHRRPTEGSATRSERDRLRRELHDGLGPTLAGTALGLRAARDALAADDHDTLGRILDRVGVEVDLAVADVRRVIDDLRPADLDDGSLDLAVRRRAASIAPAVDVEVEVGALPDLRPEVETAAYRITSEALTNVARHAGAHQVQVAVAAADGALTVRVADDGTGIPDRAPTGVGLESMRRRAHGLGGTFQVESSHDGTVVTARLPL